MRGKLMIVTLILATFLLSAFGAYSDTARNVMNANLIEAAQNGDYKAVEALLKAGADVHAKNEQVGTVLMCAVQEGHTETAELLLKHGADVNAKTNDGWTALTWANSAEVAELLLKHGADVNAKSNYGYTALMCAAEQGRKEVVNILISYGANVNARTHNGMTALMEAADYENDDKASEIVSTLIEAGAHVNTTMSIDAFVKGWGAVQGWSAVMFAEYQGNNKTVSILRKAGALGRLTPKQREKRYGNVE